MPVVAGLPVSLGLRRDPDPRPPRAAVCAVLSLSLAVLAATVPAGLAARGATTDLHHVLQGSPPQASREVLDRLWRGVDQAQTQHANGCGTLTETRTSPLLVRPLVMRGTFCAAGNDRFFLEYAAPNPIRVVYNDGALNVSTDGGKHTDAFDVGASVKRAQTYFSGPRARQNLERDFSIRVTESPGRYTLLLVPVSGRIARRVKRVLVELGTDDFLPRRIEIDGKSGVNSAFDIRIERLDVALDASVFHVYRPQPTRGRH